MLPLASILIQASRTAVHTSAAQQLVPRQKELWVPNLSAATNVSAGALFRAFEDQARGGSRSAALWQIICRLTS